MKSHILVSLIASLSLLAFSTTPSAQGAGTKAAGGKPMVVFETNQGNFTVELYPDKAPETVKNFLSYVDSGFFNGTIFHRVIPGFVIQGGGFTPDMNRKDTEAPIKNEASNGLKNSRGTLSMARTNDPNSATSQFFVNLKDNDFLDYRPGNPGYAVFAKVVDGMETVDKIAKLPTTTKGMHSDVPKEPVVVTSAKRVEAKEEKAK